MADTINPGTGPNTGTGDTLAQLTAKLNAAVSTLIAAIPAAPATKLVNFAAAPVLSSFSRASVAYAYDIDFEPKPFAVDVPRVDRRGLFTSDQAIPANLLTNHSVITPGGTETLALALGVHTLQVWGRCRATVTNAGGVKQASVDATRDYAVPGDHLTFEVTTAGNFTITYVGRPTFACLRKHPHAENFSIAAVEPETAIIPLGESTERGIFMEGGFRQIGRTQEFPIQFNDNTTEANKSRVEVQRAADGKLRLMTSITPLKTDGTTDPAGTPTVIVTPWTVAAYPGIGVAMILTIGKRHIRCYINGVDVLQMQLARVLTGAAFLLAHKWRSRIYRLENYRNTYAVMERRLAPAVYRTPGIVPRNPGDPVENERQSFSVGASRMQCRVADTIDIFSQAGGMPLGFQASDLTANRQTVIAKWDGGLVGGIDVVGKSYPITALPETGVARLSVPGAVVDPIGIYGDLTTISVGYQASRIAPYDSDRMINGDKITFQRMKLGLTFDGAGTSANAFDASGKEFTINTSVLLSATGFASSGLVRFWGQRAEKTVTRVASATAGFGSCYLPALWDLDEYAAPGEQSVMAGYDKTNRRVRPSGFNQSTENAAVNASAVENHTPLIIVGRTLDVTRHVIQQKGSSAGHLGGHMNIIGGVVEVNGGLSGDSMNGDIFCDGVRFDRSAFSETGGDVTFIRSCSHTCREFRLAFNATDMVNKGGLVSGIHSDNIQIVSAFGNMTSAYVLTNYVLLGNYQNIGQLAPQQGPQATETVTGRMFYGAPKTRLQPTYMMYAEDGEIGNAIGNDEPGGVFWSIDGSPAPTVYAQNGDRAAPKHLINSFTSIFKVPLDKLVYDNGGVRNAINGVVDKVAQARTRWGAYLAADGLSATIDKAQGFVGSWKAGQHPIRLRFNEEEPIGGLGVPGMKFQSPIAPLFCGYFAGKQQIPLEYRRSTPVEFDWQQSRHVGGGLINFMLVDPDFEGNPATTVELWRRLVPAGSIPNVTPSTAGGGGTAEETAARAAAVAFEIPETYSEAGWLAAGATKLTTLNGLGLTDVHANDNLTAGARAYYRLVTTRKDGSKKVSSMISMSGT